MNKLFFISTILCVCLQPIKAQLSFSAWSSNYMSVNSYQGYTASNAMATRFTYSGTNLNIANWKLSVSVQTPIKSTDGTSEFPPNKIAFIPVNTVGQAQPNAIPTISEIGMPSIIPLHENGETYLVPRSNAPLYNVSPYNSYYDLQLHYNIQVMPGAYLKDLQGGYNQKTYLLALTFRAYGSNNEIIGSYQQNYQIDVFKMTDSPIEQNSYSIRISSEAQKGCLEMKTLADYANGVKVVYSNGLNVTTNVAYQIALRSVSPQFVSQKGSTLPLSVVKMHLVPVGSNPASVSTIELSNTSQVIANGPSTKNTQVYYDIQYWTPPADNQLIEAVMAEYSTTLLYEITPK